MSQGGGVCVYSERVEIALELLTPGRALADRIGAGLTTVVLSPDAESHAREQIARGADHALIAARCPESPGTDFQVEALSRSIASRDIDALLIGATGPGTEVAARLAQRLGIGCAGDCTEVEFRDRKLVIERRSLGRFVCRQVVESRPAMATVQPRRFDMPERNDTRTGSIDLLWTEAPASRLRCVGTRHRDSSRVRIDKSDIVVAIGRGLKRRDDLALIEELADSLGGVVGASRPLTDDLRWLPADVKIGLSGATVRPKLYVACGISGQIEHNVGMRESGTVVAINSDPGAPIMEQADYCVVGNLYEVIPELIRSVRELSRTRRQPVPGPSPSRAPRPPAS